MIPRAIAAMFLAAAMAVASSPVRADEIFINTLSAHFGYKKSKNNVNVGVLYLFNNRAVTGAFYNTHYKMSYFVGYYTPVKQIATRLGRYELTPGFISGIATGYPDGLTPGVVPTLTMGISHRWDLNLTITPIKGGVVSLAVGYKL